MKRVKEFLKNHWDQTSPLLLGYSGGPDSKALLYGLIEAGCKELHVAHVDHGWRKESKEEAKELKKEVEDLGLPFHLKRLKEVPDGNREDFARKERILFFRSLFEKVPFQALVLGHHANDLAETVLKRLFEGAHLPFLKGMQPISELGGLSVWRPLLGESKKNLIRALEKKGLEPLYDATNHDPAYLRSRLREEIFPFLHKNFGKNIVDNLCLLSERSSELKSHLDKRVAHLQVKKDEKGIEVPLDGLERLERRHLLQKIGALEDLALTRIVLEKVLDLVDGKSFRKIPFSSYLILSGKGKVCFLKS